ncbi:hypothetical protein [Mycoavidus sp. B2-EB]|uniref:hypothetical protein n=1 Tax=Mycoavidus sp. B2-EB TaxID=2651972 RepID=UPI0016286C03|nr:hypothetical protein [Mycoavidus sp. B2-EB]BBO60186.1 hypothetical protein MPB2EB_1325 [Mycoavidus sp. B2-EB]
MSNLFNLSFKFPREILNEISERMDDETREICASALSEDIPAPDSEKNKKSASHFLQRLPSSLQLGILEQRKDLRQFALKLPSDNIAQQSKNKNKELVEQYIRLTPSLKGFSEYKQMLENVDTCSRFAEIEPKTKEWIEQKLMRNLGRMPPDPDLWNGVLTLCGWKIETEGNEAGLAQEESGSSKLLALVNLIPKQVVHAVVLEAAERCLDKDPSSAVLKLLISTILEFKGSLLSRDASVLSAELALESEIGSRLLAYADFIPDKELSSVLLDVTERCLDADWKDILPNKHAVYGFKLLEQQLPRMPQEDFPVLLNGLVKKVFPKLDRLIRPDLNNSEINMQVNPLDPRWARGRIVEVIIEFIDNLPENERAKLLIGTIGDLSGVSGIDAVREQFYYNISCIWLAGLTDSVLFKDVLLKLLQEMPRSSAGGLPLDIFLNNFKELDFLDRVPDESLQSVLIELISKSECWEPLGATLAIVKTLERQLPRLSSISRASILMSLVENIKMDKQAQPEAHALLDESLLLLSPAERQPIVDVLDAIMKNELSATTMAK